MDYSKFLYHKAQAESVQEPATNVSPYLAGEQLPPNAIIVHRDDMYKKKKPEDFHSTVSEDPNMPEPAFVFRRVNQHEVLFTVPFGGPLGINEAARARIKELGLENERFFFQMGNQNRFIEATQRLVG